MQAILAPICRVRRGLIPALALMEQSQYWYTDTESDAVGSLSAAADFLKIARENPDYWKWSVVALHSAVQGILVLSLHDGIGLLVQKPGRAKAMFAALQGEPGNLVPYMDNFMGLYRKAQDPINFSGRAPPVPADPDLQAAIEAFDQMRHDLLHFNSKGWSIHIPLLISRCRSALAVAVSVLDSGVIFWLTEERELQAHAHLERALQELPG